MLSYQGSKSSVGKWIREFIPQDIKTYVEPFSGMFKVFYNMNLELYPHLDSIVYNDFNPVNSNIFKCVQENYKRLLDEVLLIPYPFKDKFNFGDETDWIYSSNFYEFQDNIFNKSYDLNNPNFRAAAEYAYVLSHTYNGHDPQKSVYLDTNHKITSKYSAFINKLNCPTYQNHFERISHVHSLDFSECIEKYDAPHTLIYLDPPYKDKEHFYSNHNFNIHSHERLVDQLKTLKGKWILSYYFFDELLEWLPIDRYKWYSKTFWRPSAKKSGATGEEILILNFEPEVIPADTNCISEPNESFNTAA